MKDKGVLKFWWGEVFVSYGKPTKFDPFGCEGVYVENIHYKNYLCVFFLYLKEKFK